MYCVLHKIAPANNEKTFKITFSIRSRRRCAATFFIFIFFLYICNCGCNRGQKQGKPDSQAPSGQQSGESCWKKPLRWSEKREGCLLLRAVSSMGRTLLCSCPFVSQQPASVCVVTLDEPGCTLCVPAALACQQVKKCPFHILNDVPAEGKNKREKKRGHSKPRACVLRI